MPRISIEDAIANSDVLPGRPLIAEPTPEQPTPGLLDVAAAAERQNNIASSLPRLLESFVSPQASMFSHDIDDPSYDPFNDIKGFEEHADRFIRSHSPAETARIKERLTRETTDRDVLMRAGWAGTAASVAAGMTDPVTLLSMAVPLAPALGGASRAARIAAGVATSVGLDTASEVALHQMQELRTAQESIINVGAGALLTGVLGRVATRVPKSELDDAIKRLGDELHGPEGGSTAGAAAVEDATTLADEGVAKGGRMIAKTVGKISPLTRLLSSPSKSARRLVQRLADVPYMLEKNLRGVANPQSLEAVVKRRSMQSKHRMITSLDETFRAYKAKGGTLRLREFGEQVAKAMRRGDKSAVPEVASLAAKTRELFNADRAELKKLGALPEDFDLLGAESYFPRVYDYEQIIKNRDDLERRLRDWYSNNPHPQLKKTHDEATLAETDAATKADEARAVSEGHLEVVRTARADAVAPARRLRTAKTETARTRRAAEKSARLLAQRTDKVAGLKKIAADAQQAHAEAVARASTPAAEEGENAANAARAAAARQTRDAAARELERAEARLAHAETMADTRAAKAEAAEDAERAATTAHRNARTAATKAIGKARTVKSKSAEATRAAESAAKDREKAFDAMTAHREPGEVDATVQQTIERILGTIRGAVDVGGASKPAPFKGRVLDAPDDILEPYLVSDFEHVVGNYINSTAAQIEMRKAFENSTSLEREIAEITDEYAGKINRAKTNKKKEKLGKAMKQDVNDVQRIAGRLLGQVGPRGNEALGFVRTARLFRHFNYVRLLGGQTLSSFSDYGRMIGQYGLGRTGAATAKFLTSLKGNKLTREDAKRMGTALEWTVNTRSSTLADIGGETAGTKLERLAGWGSQKFSRLTLMSTWNSALKAIASQLQQDVLLRAVKGRANKMERARLASLGVDDEMLERIGQQVEKHASDADGLWRARTELWDDQEAAKTVETAIVNAADQAIISRGVGDIPNFMDGEVWKSLLQFKSFGMASVNRISIPMAQGLAQGDIASVNGLASMLGLGALTYYVKDLAANRKPDLSPDRVIPEMLNWSGIAGILPDIYDPVAGMLHLPRLSRYKDRSGVESLLGPTFGTATDLYGTIAGVTDGDFKQKDLHKIRKLLPLQNLFYFRQLINALEGEMGEQFGLEGATTKPFTERITELQEDNK